MKKITLTSIMIAILAITLSAKTPAQIMQTDLIGSWEYKTTYTLDSITCYLKTDDYLFFGENDCILKTNVVNCISQANKVESQLLKWRIVANTIILYDQNNSIVKYFSVKNNIGTILYGEKIITDTKDISSEQEEELFSQVMN